MWRVRSQALLWPALAVGAAGLLLYWALARKGPSYPTLLSLGVSVEREIEANNPQRYSLLGREGDYVEVIISQAEMDVSATFSELTPHERDLQDLNLVLGRGGEERLFAIVPETGRYLLTVRAEEETGRGTYQIRLVASRQATSVDRLRAQAADVFDHAEQLRRAGAETATKESIPYFEEASALWKELGNSELEIEARFRLGLARSDLGEGDRALDLFENEVLPHWTGTPNEPRLRNLIGDFYLGSANYPKALEHLGIALKTAYATHNISEQMRALTNLAYTYVITGEAQAALDAVETARTLDGASDNDLADLLDTVAELYYSLGAFRQAIRSADQALEVEDRARNWALSINSLRSKGLSQYRLGRHDEALKTLSLARVRALEHAPDKEAEILVASGTVLVERYDKRSNNPNDLLEGERDLVRAIDLSQKYKKDLVAANAKAYLGRVRDLQHKEAEAVDLYSEAHDIYSRNRHAFGTAATLNGRARPFRDMGKLVEAQRDIETALSCLVQLEKKPVSATVRANYLAARRTFYDFYAELLLEMGDPRKSFRVSEGFRSRSVLEALQRNNRTWKGVSSDRMERLRDLKAKLTADKLDPRVPIEWESLRAEIQAEVSGLRIEPDPLEVEEIQSGVLDDSSLLLVFRLGEQSSTLWVIGRDLFESFALPRRREIEDLAKLVSKGMAASHNSAKAQATYGDSRRLSQMLLGKAAHLLGSHRLVIAPDGALHGVSFVALPDPRALEGAAAPADLWPSPLGEMNEVVYIPSATVLSELRRVAGERPKAQLALLAIGDAIYEREDPRLEEAQPWWSFLGLTLGASAEALDAEEYPRLEASGKEVEALVGEFPQSEVLKLTGFDARRDRVLSPSLSQYAIIHFAGHSISNPEFPDLSGLLLSSFDERGRRQDGLISMYDIYDTQLSADLVVLSACSTASGEEVEGEGRFGLAHALFQAGVPRVVVSLWKIDDVATAELMRHFYHGLRKEGLTPAAALRKAQLAMWRQPRWSAPYYWAAFELQGDWR